MGGWGIFFCFSIKKNVTHPFKDVRAKILKILPLKDDELVMSEILKKWGVTDFVLERRCPEEHLNLSGCKSQNIAIRALKGNVLCQIWFKWTY